jgi:transcriptional regulator with XRE-family HTH domain
MKERLHASMQSLRAQFAALRSRFPARRAPEAGREAAAPGVEPLLELGKSLQQRRESMGLSMRQLSLETRVSTAVLEALEKGWTKRLPEALYLGTILHKLAERLQLPADQLDAALQAALPQPSNTHELKESALGRFTLSSIDLFSTWQGTIAYAALMLGLLYGLNLQQRQLAAANVLSFKPIPANTNNQAAPAVAQGSMVPATELLLQLYPDLRPLQRPVPLPLQRLSQLEDGSAPALKPSAAPLPKT